MKNRRQTAISHKTRNGVSPPWLSATVVLLAAVLSSCGVALVSSTQRCDVCLRDLHSESLTVAVVGGNPEQFCCPACALSAGTQRGEPVRFVRFTDHDTGEPVERDAAFLVRDSSVNLCARRQVVVDESRHACAGHFDRCAPSVIAFARQEAAARFIARHGGRPVRAADLSLR